MTMSGETRNSSAPVGRQRALLAFVKQARGV